MSAEYAPSAWEPIAEHVEQYLSTNGEQGGVWMDAPCIVLETTGAKSGATRRTPLIRVRVGDGYVVIGSMGGAPTNPAWVHNLRAHESVVVYDMAEQHALRAREVSGDEKASLWAEATSVWPDYDAYQASTERVIPLFYCEPV
ncbi:MAG: nitroreductase family deazaflavin-dependent oxidoreductase [Actinomycetes bacterium]